MKKVLVVDDSTLARKYLTQIFENLGFIVDTAKDGNEAIEKTLKNSYDLITLDIEMPDKNGLEVLQEIMEKKPTRVIIISSYAQDRSQNALKALNLGALDTIVKDSAHLVGTQDSFRTELQQKIKHILDIPKYAIIKKRSKLEIKKPTKFIPTQKNGYVLIGASTGGPGLIERLQKQFLQIIHILFV